MVKVIVFGHDPGVRNYGFCLLEATLTSLDSPPKLRVLQHGMLKDTIEDLTDKKVLQQSRRAYKIAVRRVLQRHGLKTADVHVLIAERFMTRGSAMGPTIERISMMLGVLADMFDGTPMRLITASQWKMALKRKGVDLKDKSEYKRIQKPTTVHEFDATMIAVYGLHQAMRLKNFHHLKYEEVLRVLSSGKNRNNA